MILRKSFQKTSQILCLFINLLEDTFRKAYLKINKTIFLKSLKNKNLISKAIHSQSQCISNIQIQSQNIKIKFILDLENSIYNQSSKMVVIMRSFGWSTKIWFRHLKNSQFFSKHSFLHVKRTSTQLTPRFSQ